MDNQGQPFTIHGAREAGPQIDGMTSTAKSEGLRVEQKGAVALNATRAADREAIVTWSHVADDDLLELEIEGGPTVWVTAREYRERLGAPSARGEPHGGVNVYPQLDLGPIAWGAGSIVIKALKWLGVDLVGETTKGIAHLVEQRLDQAAGLYRLSLTDGVHLSPLSAIPGAPQPSLLFIHSTASSTAGTFRGLWQPNQGALKTQLVRCYGERIFALEHKTLTQDPIDNALALAQGLPQRTHLHLVTHSRGGLVGELICRGCRSDQTEPFTQRELVQFEAACRKRLAELEGVIQREKFIPWQRAADDPPPWEKLSQLNDLLKEKKIRVSRFVRVACPARGTTLASGRLDRWLNVLFNLVGETPGMAALPIYGDLKNLLLAAVKTRSDPRFLPGLEAMMPDSPLIRLLNAPHVRSTADLSIVSGDIEPGHFFSKLLLLMPDAFYGGQHDLLVNTRAMAGGAPRAKDALKFFDQGPHVHHWNYFHNHRSARKIVQRLTSEDQSGFEPHPVTPQEIPRDRASKRSEPLPLVVVVPGIFGSHLRVNQQRIWLDSEEIYQGGLARLQAGAKARPESLVELHYSHLIQYLSRSQQVVPFAYDWRLSLTQAARELGASISRHLDRSEALSPPQPLRILAHGSGGLVVRAMLALHPELDQRMKARDGNRLVFLGTPHQGSFVVPRMLMGRDPLIAALAAADFQYAPREILDILAGFPGLLCLLPQTGGLDFFSLAHWKALNQADPQGDWGLPSPAALEEARQLAELLQNGASDRRGWLCVAGVSGATPNGLDISGGPLSFSYTAKGDGWAPWETGIPPGIEPWFFPTPHGNLASDPSGFQAILELLEQGHTRILAKTPPSPPDIVRGWGSPSDKTLPLFPGAEELALASLGGRPMAQARRRLEPLTASVVHGDLVYSRYPVAVGHYAGDMIASAEAVLDHQLKGRLSRRHALGLYPGGLGSCDVVLARRTSGALQGALVVGLGTFGELTADKLEHSMHRALVKYALQMAETPNPEDRSTEPETPGRLTQLDTAKLGLSALLVGTGTGGISLKDAMSAMLRAVFQANRELSAAYPDGRIAIAEVQFVERWRINAIRAARVLKELSERLPIQAASELGTIPGGCHRIDRQEDPNWWHRVMINDDGRGQLRFNLISGRARTEVSLLATDRRAVDAYIGHIIGTTSRDANDDVPATLFELLVPNPLKAQTPDGERLVFNLDEHAARYPWEMLVDRKDQSGGDLYAPGSHVLAPPQWTPFAIKKHLIRQLASVTFRRHPDQVTRNSALVVGDPASEFAPLSGARMEARAVAETLEKNGLETVARIGASANEILTSLFSKDYRILHFAAHGVYEYPLAGGGEVCDHCGQPSGAAQEEERVTGLVIGKGRFLRPSMAEQIRYVPELVFLNCCHLGKEDGSSSAKGDSPPSYHKIAANLATQFIRMGARMVIAAGWAVDDRAARTFATEFYRAFLTHGEPFGEAVHHARRVVYDTHPHVNTFGAYQCYGDPDHTWSGRSGASLHARPRHFVSSIEICHELDNITARAKTAPPTAISVLAGKVDQLSRASKTQWPSESSIQTALGRAWGELGQLPDAISAYRQAVAGERATATLTDLEQLANLEGRYALLLWKSQQPKAELNGTTVTPKTLLDLSLKRLEGLIQIGETVERLCLKGAAYKRRALIAETFRSRKTALKQMAESYKIAHRRLLKHAASEDPYPTLNWITAEFLLAWYSLDSNPTPKGGLLEREGRAVLNRVRRDAQALFQRKPNFWSGVHAADALLLQHLSQFSLTRHAPKLIQFYLDAIQRAASGREFQSVLDHLYFLSSLAGHKPKPNTRDRDLTTALQTMLKELEKSVV